LTKSEAFRKHPFYFFTSLSFRKSIGAFTILNKNFQQSSSQIQKSSFKKSPPTLFKNSFLWAKFTENLSLKFYSFVRSITSFISISLTKLLPSHQKAYHKTSSLHLNHSPPRLSHQIALIYSSENSFSGIISLAFDLFLLINSNVPLISP